MLNLSQWPFFYLKLISVPQFQVFSFRYLLEMSSKQTTSETLEVKAI